MTSPTVLIFLLATYVSYAHAWYMTVYYTDGTGDRVYGESPGPTCRIIRTDKRASSIFVLDPSYDVWLQLYADPACAEFIRNGEEGTTEMLPGEIVQSFKVIVPCLSSASCPEGV